jgi:hypothetical protein
MASWRDVLPIHPAANLFPRMTPDELAALGKDIKRNGLTSPIVLWSDGKAPARLFDGINRLDAIEMAIGPAMVGPPSLSAGKDFLACNKVIVLDRSVDPYAFVISANIHRRHLTTEQKREIVAALLKANPERSNNATAKIAKVDDKTVGAVRAELERRSEIPNVSTRTDSKGRQQPAKKTTTKPTPSAAPNSKSKSDGKARDDIGADSASECERLRERNEELEEEKYRLERSNISLRSEIGGGKPGLAEKLDPLLETLFDQGTKNMATMSPTTVGIAVCMLERLLVEYGIMPPSRRSEDPQGYARLLKQRAARQRDKDHTPKSASRNKVE